jgi:hypothetical protein
MYASIYVLIHALVASLTLWRHEINSGIAVFRCIHCNRTCATDQALVIATAAISVAVADVWWREVTRLPADACDGSRLLIPRRRIGAIVTAQLSASRLITFTATCHSRAR